MAATLTHPHLIINRNAILAGKASVRIITACRWPSGEVCSPGAAQGGHERRSAVLLGNRFPAHAMSIR